MEILEYLVRLRGAKEAAAQADAVAASQERIAHATRRVGTESGIAASAFGRSIGHMKSMAMSLAGVAVGGLAIFASIRGIKSAVESTMQLAVAARSLSRVTGMNLNSAAQWLAVSEAYGVAGRTLTMSFRTLATQGEGALGTSKKAAQAFKALGISTQELTAHSHDMSGMFGLVADKLNAMPGGMAKTAIAAQLLGRGWQKLMPLLSAGSKGMEDMRRTAAAYGVTLGGDPLKNVQKLHEAQVKLQLAQIGLQVQISEKLAPAFIWLMNKALALYRTIEHQLGPTIRAVTGFFHKHTDAVRALGIVVAVLTGLLVAHWIATKIITAATVAWRVATLLATGAQWALNAAMDANPIGAVILVLGLLATAVGIAATHWNQFRDGVVKVWDDIKGAARDAYNFIIGILQNIANGINAVMSAWVSIPGNPFSWTDIHLHKLTAPHDPSSTIGMADVLGKRGAQRVAPSTIGMADVLGKHGPQRVVKSAHASDAGVHLHGDIVVKVGAHELARLQRREIIKAMAANA